MSNVRSVILLLLILLLLSLFWLYPAATQRAPTPLGPVAVHESHSNASINRISQDDMMAVGKTTVTQDVGSPQAAAMVGSTSARPLQAPNPNPNSNPAQAQAQAQAELLDTPPEWTAALQHLDKEVRRKALQQWAGQGAATPLDPLTHALVDPDESVRAKAQELVEQVWLAKAEAR